MDILEQVRRAIPGGLTIYLVGGAVRDLLLGKPSHDLDFVLLGDALAVSRRVANNLGAAFYPLDEVRDTGRVLLKQHGQPSVVLDFASLRGVDLEADLRARDFTINAMALEIHTPEQLIDPLRGARDLHEHLLRACSPVTFTDDPLRILRAIRLAVTYQLRIIPETRQRLRQAVPLLPGVSPERLRDELFRLLDGRHPATALRALDLMDILPAVLPELPSLKGISQSPPHIYDVWNHTLDTMQNLEALLIALGLHHDEEYVANWSLGLVSVRLGRFRAQIHEHMAQQINPNRSIRALLFLAALYHDIAKPQTLKVDDRGGFHFYGHDDQGSKIIGERARQLRLSNAEIERLEMIVRNHLQPLFLAKTTGIPSGRAIHRFFRKTGAAGVEVCLLSLADYLSTYGSTLSQEGWSRQIDVTRALLEAWWDKPQEIISPQALINGHDIMDIFNLPPGPQIGILLEQIHEAQAAGEVRTMEEAIQQVAYWLQNNTLPGSE